MKLVIYTFTNNSFETDAINASAILSIDDGGTIISEENIASKIEIEGEKINVKSLISMPLVRVIHLTLEKNKNFFLRHLLSFFAYL